MTDIFSLRRLEENERVFRSYNEAALDGLAELSEMAKETGQDHLVDSNDGLLHFYCECSNTDCRQRIVLTPDDYTNIHHNRKRFVIAQGHQIEKVENVVQEKQNYNIVEKII